MNWIAIVAVYFVVWWVVLFAVLPWGTRSQEEDEESVVLLGTQTGAPAKPMLIRKAIATSIVAAVVVGVLWVLVDVYGVTFETIANRFDLRQ